MQSTIRFEFGHSYFLKHQSFTKKTYGKYILAEKIQKNNKIIIINYIFSTTIRDSMTLIANFMVSCQSGL